ncbi:MAG: type II secretion system protein GspD [Prosthecobacter sp.]|jgi:general secretion pathway protein D|uniref:type II secretion system protein GspD n=1 Tax=Prosthecobacter sp. TaxID=1965333 RepID=UPI0019FA8584|nr:secretin N-terminal domain-containing protein [Prosthecobacter sp.]MBE2286744.1 type II secretion system protein GspD [Prosthecobacter sp.]
MNRLLSLLFFLLAMHAQAQTGRMEVIDLRQVPLSDAARILSEAGGLNVVSSVEAGKTIVSLYLTQVQARDAVEALCRSHNLWFREDEKSGIIRIHTPEEYKRDLGSFQEELTEVFDLRFPNANDVGRAIQDLYGPRVRMNQSNFMQDFQATMELQQRFQRFDIVDGRSQNLGVSGQTGNNSVNSAAQMTGAGGMAGGRVSVGRNGLGAGGFGAGGFGSGFNTTSFQTIPEPQRIENLTAEEIQTLEDRAENAEKMLDDRVNIFVTVIQRLNKVIVRTGDSRAMAQIKELITSVDVPTQTVLLEVKILRVRMDQGYRSAVDYLFDNGRFQAGFGANPVQAGDLSFRFASNNFSARIQVLEQKGQVRVVSTPTLLIANNEVSRLFIGEERPLNRSFNGGAVIPGAINNVVTQGSTDIEFRPVGTTLLITPNINADKTVTLRLLQENSNITTNGASVLVPNNNGFQRQSVDTVQSRTVSGTVVARHQVPVVIGGLIDTHFTDTRSQVPILGNIPLIGTLFRRVDDTKSREELVLMINPQLIDPREGGADASQQMLKDNQVNGLETMAVGQHIHERLNDHLPAPLPPTAQPAEQTAPTPKKRNLIDWFRRNQPVP